MKKQNIENQSEKTLLKKILLSPRKLNSIAIILIVSAYLIVVGVLIGVLGNAKEYVVYPEFEEITYSDKLNPFLKVYSNYSYDSTNDSFVKKDTVYASLYANGSDKVSNVSGRVSSILENKKMVYFEDKTNEADKITTHTILVCSQKTHKANFEKFFAEFDYKYIENNEEKYGNIQYEESVLQLTKADKARETADEFLTEKYTIENEEYKIFSSFSVTYEHKVEDKNNIISLKFGLSSKLKGEYHLDIQMYGVKDKEEYPLVGYYNLSNNVLSSYSQNATVSDKLNFDYIYVKATVLDLNGITHEIFYKQAFADLEKK